MISQEKKGRMRPATCWRRRWKLLSAQHKDRSLALQGAEKKRGDRGKFVYKPL